MIRDDLVSLFIAALGRAGVFYMLKYNALFY